MLKFYRGKFNNKDIDAYSEAINQCCFSIMQLSGCVNHDSHLQCHKCYYKNPCRDFMRLKWYLDTLVENPVENVENQNH